MSSFWNWYIIIIVLGLIFGSAILLYFTHNIDTGDIKEGESMGHSFDGIEELNNPLPKWWNLMFWITIIYSLGYLALYPGLGSYQGLLGWSSTGQWQSEMDKAEKTYGPIYERMAATPIEELVNSDEALNMGQRLFANNCAVCHGSDARGAQGYPDLTDNDWLYGSNPAQIKQSIMAGRTGMMPALGSALGGEQGVKQVASYVRSLNGYKADADAAAQGEQKFKMFCVACHGMDAKGNQLLGAPNLTDGIWLYGGSQKIVEQTISEGRSGKMPSHKDLLGEEKVHILATYIYNFAKTAE
jgi:cytochrome c oxidase cbb3-type subunit 3